MRSALLTIFMLAVLTVVSSAEILPKVKAYRLDVTFVPEESAMSGMAAITFEQPVPTSRRLGFYLHGELEVDSIKQSGRLVDFEQEKALCFCDYSYVITQVEANPVSSNPDDTLFVFYRGYFNSSKARSPSDYMRIDDDGVFLRALSYSPWFPLFVESWRDSYAVDFAEVTVRTPKDFQTVFAGKHLGDSIAGDIRISRWQAMNTQQFEVQCTSQKFSKLSVGPVHVYYWSDSASVAAAQSIADFVTFVARRFEESYRSDASAGEFHIAEMPKYGDISSGNMSSLQVSSWRKFNEETWAQRGLAHEIVHPFVRPAMDKNDPLYALLVEGFPSYFHLPILQEIHGDDWYAAYMKRTEDRYLKYKATGKDRRGNDLPVEKPIDQIAGDEVGEYKDLFILSDRALLFFNYIRAKMGRERFAEFCHDLFDRESLTDSSFREIVSNYLGGSREDVDLWLSGTDYPERLRLREL